MARRGKNDRTFNAASVLLTMTGLKASNKGWGFLPEIINFYFNSIRVSEVNWVQGFGPSILKMVKFLMNHYFVEIKDPAFSTCARDPCDMNWSMRYKAFSYIE